MVVQKKKSWMAWSLGFVLSLGVEAFAAEKSQTQVNKLSEKYCKAYKGEKLALPKHKPKRITGVSPAYEGFNIIEGPLWLDGTLYYSNIGTVTTGQQSLTNQSSLWRWVPGKQPQEWLSDSVAGTNGLALDINDRIVAARQRDGSIVSIDPKSGKLTAIAKQYEDKRFNAPNDLVVATNGAIYFTDPTWNTPSDIDPQTTQGGGAPGAITPGQRIYRVGQDGSVAALPVTEQVKALRDKPNGVMLSLDESKLLIGGLQGLWEFDLINEWPANPRKLHDQQVDGMGRDCAGNIYVTTKRKIKGEDTQIVLVLDSMSKEVGVIRVPGAQTVTNIAFGGQEQKTLFITTLGSSQQDDGEVQLCDGVPCQPAGLYQVRLNVPGLPY